MGNRKVPGWLVFVLALLGLALLVPVGRAWWGALQAKAEADASIARGLAQVDRAASSAPVRP